MVKMIGIFNHVVIPKNKAQDKYVRMIYRNTITLGTGSAGTGKTHLAIAVGLSFLVSKKVDTLILSRPIVEAGEKLGHLPGEIEDKIQPYFIPVMSSIKTILGADKTAQYIKWGKIEIAPLAYMRGRTFDRSFVILDEAQNATRNQIKMLLTRLGNESKLVINGDTDQVDIRGTSGLQDAVERLQGIDGIDSFEFTDADIVRSPLIKEILISYR